MKVAVYSICKNEIDQVEAYMDHLDALDLKPYVLDHSTDGTTERLRTRSAIVDTTPIEDWWWDRGKNAAMDLVPDDVDFCVNIDMDERLSENFWDIFAQIRPDAKLIQHLYKPDGVQERVRYDWRLHARHGCRWSGPVHEYLGYTGPVKFLKPEKFIQNIDQLLITHWPPPNKNHVPVETVLRACKAFPDDVRIKALAGRELYFSGRIAEASDKFKEFLHCFPENEIDTCYAHRMLARCYEKQGQYDHAIDHYVKAAIYPSREARIDLANYYYSCKAWGACYEAARSALEITEGRYLPNSDPDCWSFKPHELIAIALLESANYDLALQAAETAMGLASMDSACRIAATLKTIRAKRDEARKKKI